MNPYTTWIYSKGPQLIHRNPHFNFGVGQWELVIHSLVVDEGHERTPAIFKLSSNLVRHIEGDNKIQTPLHIIGHGKNGTFKTYRFTGFTNFVVTNKEDSIVINIDTFKGKKQSERKFGVHLSLIRLS